jgi:hypothetical protein
MHNTLMSFVRVTSSWVVARSEAARTLAHAQYDDIGRYAAYLSVDIVHVAEFDYYLVLNRTAVRVQQESLR